MKGESNIDRGRLKGYLFEVVISLLLEKYDFDRVKDTKGMYSYYTEFVGRGTTHQIDCPYDYPNIIPFINQLRILGEVKCKRDPTDKSEIRSFIGTVKDISENYITNDVAPYDYKRYTELGVFFSASGFEIEAVRLALAHNIKTVSYKDNSIIKGLIQELFRLEEEQLKASVCIKRDRTIDFLESFRAAVTNPTYKAFDDFVDKYCSNDQSRIVLTNIFNLLSSVKSSFLATTTNGRFIHFLSKGEFPESVYFEKDLAQCKVFYRRKNNKVTCYLEFNEDKSELKAKFYFTVPEDLKEAILNTPEKVLELKHKMIDGISFLHKIKGLQRVLMLELDFQDYIERNRSKQMTASFNTINIEVD